jgi:hypothetical protein
VTPCQTIPKCLAVDRYKYPKFVAVARKTFDSHCLILAGTLLIKQDDRDKQCDHSKARLKEIQDRSKDQNYYGHAP